MIELRLTKSPAILGIRILISTLVVLTLCLASYCAQAAQDPDAIPKRLKPLDSIGQPVVWCYQGQVSDTRLVVVDKSRQRLMVLRYLGKLALEFEYPCASGERSGSKKASQEEKTPEGVYFVTKRFGDNKITIFGDRALHLNYPNPQDRAQWRKHKRYLNRAYKKITVNISDIMIKVRGDQAQVSFVQRYRSDWHQDTGLKSMDLVLVNGHWLMRTETWHKMPPAVVRKRAYCASLASASVKL